MVCLVATLVSSNNWENVAGGCHEFQHVEVLFILTGKDM
jgi:hypothetical protein